mgnify:CR=1 FL=1
MYSETTLQKASEQPIYNLNNLIMEWIFNQLRERPELAIFLTIFLGFWLGKLRIGKFTLGTVTSVLLVGVLVGQLNIAVPGPIKSVFFLLFLFAVGYKVGPQFFRGLKKDGLPQVGFAVLMCVSVLLVTWLLALMMGYNAGEAAGLLAGSQTISAVIGVAEDTMANMGLDEAQRQSYVNIIPVSYAVTYIFGTAGSAWVLSSIGPKMLGGLEKVKAACKELEAKMGSSLADEPGFMPAARPVTFRAYRVENEWFKNGKRVIDLEVYFRQHDKRLFVERLRKSGVVVEVSMNIQIEPGDEVVLSGRREYIIGEESWIGPEVQDAQLLDFPAEKLPVTITRKTVAGKTVAVIRREKVHARCQYPEHQAHRNIHSRAGTNGSRCRRRHRSGRYQAGSGSSSQTSGVYRPPYQPDGYDIRRPGYPCRRFVRSTFRPYRRHPHQLEHKRRRIDCGLVLRLAPQ